jgi:hypothetical protein
MLFFQALIFLSFFSVTCSAFVGGRSGELSITQQAGQGGVRNARDTGCRGQVTGTMLGEDLTANQKIIYLFLL